MKSETRTIGFHVVACLTLVMMGGIVFGDGQPSNGQDFPTFWQIFRQATLEKDWHKLEGMCNFPLTVRGELDRDPVRRVGKREFRQAFTRFLSEGVFSANEELEFIRKTPVIPKQHRGHHSVARVGDLVFKKAAHGWLLDTLYMQHISE